MQKSLLSGLLAVGLVALGTSGAASATVLTGKFNVDNSYAAYISTSDSVQGSQFSSGNNWMSTYTNTVSMSAGIDYYLHVFAHDEGGIAGFLGQFTMSGTDHAFANGLTTLLTETADWHASVTGWGGSNAALLDLGGNGVGPWGTRGPVAGSARWIWAVNSDTTNDVWFSTRITAAPVPEPTSLALLGLGFTGLFVARRRKV